MSKNQQTGQPMVIKVTYGKNTNVFIPSLKTSWNNSEIYAQLYIQSKNR